MTTGHVFIATSLDGFVARPDHSLDWLMARDDGDEDQGYEAFIAEMDGLIMGRASYETVLGFGDWPYAKPVVVLSRSLTQADLPDALRGKITISSASPDQAMADRAEQGWRKAYVDGGQVVQSFLRAGLIAELTITTIPVLIGEGRPLFGPLDRDIELELCESRGFACGYVQTRYKVRP